MVGPNLLVIPRDVFGPIGSSMVDDEEEEEEDEEDEEEDDAEEQEGEVDDEDGEDEHSGRERERDRSMQPKEEKRTRSLDRGLRPIIPEEKPSRSYVSPTTIRQKSVEVNPSWTQGDPFNPTPSDTTVSTGEELSRGRGTMGRGRQSRGTMLWSSDASPTPQPPDPDREMEYTLGRTESAETMVHVGSDNVEQNESEMEDGTVPKDEIELMEEEGNIPPESSVAPLPDTGLTSNSTTATQDISEADDMEEIELEHATPSNGPAQAGVSSTEESTEISRIDNDGIPDSDMSASSSKLVEEDGQPRPTEEARDGALGMAEDPSELVVSSDEAKEVDKANEEAREAI